MTRNIAVVGAGLAGVTAALLLQQAGCRVTVFDKSRGFGGRLATRRGDGFAIDHGAAGAHGDAPGFAAAMSAAGAADTGHDGWIGQPGMSAIVRAMAAPLDCVMGKEIMAVEDVRGSLVLADSEGGRHGPFDRVVSAIPAPQARRFLTDRPEEAALDPVVMDPVWTLLLAFPAASGVTRPVTGVPFESTLLSSARPGRAVLPETWVAHAGAGWTRDHLEMTKEEACSVLTAAFAEAAGQVLPEPLYAAAHRWRHGRVATPLGRPFLNAMGGRLVLGGDWALGATAGDAFVSGQAMAEAVRG